MHIFKQVNLYGLVSSYVSFTGTMAAALKMTTESSWVTSLLYQVLRFFSMCLTLLPQSSHTNLFKKICLKRSPDKPSCSICYESIDTSTLVWIQSGLFKSVFQFSPLTQLWLCHSAVSEHELEDALQLQPGFQ